MDLPDYQAHADYWTRQVELHPASAEVLDMRALAMAELIVQTEAVCYLNPDLES